ncbi:MAG: serine/threonine protein kinase [Polyangiales bacterium]
MDETRSHLAELFAGRFTIHRKLPWNGMALVYHASSLNDAVALAVLPLDCEATGANHEVFTRTMDRVATVPHPVFLPIKETGIQLGVPFVAYHWEERECLEAMLQGGALSWGLASRVARRVLQGLLSAHEQGVFHGDLTPSNVLYSPDDDEVRVVGLGFAPMLRLVRPDTTGPTGRGSGPGAVRYLAPEILSGERGSSKADVFAVGALLHRMMSGQAPGKGTVDESEVPGLASFISVAMNADPAKRFADVAAMLKALLALDAAPVKREPSVAIPLWEDAPRKAAASTKPAKSRTGLWFALLLLLVAVGAAVFVGMQPKSDANDDVADVDQGARDDASEERPSTDEPDHDEVPVESDPSGGELADEALDEALDEVLEGVANEALESEDELAEASDDVGELAGEVPDEVDEAEEMPDEAPAAPAGDGLLSGELPDFLAETMAKIRDGYQFEHPDYREIYGWIRNHREDVRGHLVLSRAFMSRGWYTAAFERYGHLFGDFPEETQGDPQSLRDLIEIIGKGDDMLDVVFPMLRRYYGRDALPEVEAAMAATERRRETRQLRALQRRLNRL